MACQLKEAVELLLSKPVAKNAFKAALAKISTSKTPLFDSLPAKSKSPTMTYAGVGSRKTPKAILDKMTEVAKTLSDSGYTLRSGGAKGADSAFEIGAGKKAVFKTNDATNTTLAIAEEIHPNWKALTAKGDDSAKLMARNTNQVFGENLDTPSDFLLVWTKDAKEVGGTAQAMKMARLKGIPVINMANATWETELRGVLNTLSESRKGTSKPQTASEGKSTQGSDKSSPEAANEGLAEILEQIASSFHELWRTDFAAANGKNAERVKTTKDAKWVKNNQGKTTVNINTEYANLPDDWKGENKANAEVALDMALRVNSKELSLEDAASIIHEEWLHRNPWAPEAQKLPYSKLSEDEKVKDRNSVITAITLLSNKPLPQGKSLNTLEFNAEVTDVYSIFNLLGLTPSTHRIHYTPTVEELAKLQMDVLSKINDLDISGLQKLLDNNRWIIQLTNGEHVADRQGRASSKNGTRSGADKYIRDSTEYTNAESKYLMYQIAEEINEVIGTLDIADALKDLLVKQKELFKVSRFGANTKIKDGTSVDTNGNQVYLKAKDGSILTNLKRVQETFNDPTIQDVNRLLQEVTTDVLNSTNGNGGDVAAKAQKTIIDSNQKGLGAPNKIVDNIADTLDMYHGTSVDITNFIDKDGNLVLIPAKNFGGKTQSISFTHSKDTAMRYASQIKGGGPSGFNFLGAYAFKIDAGSIPNLVRESEEEFAINTNDTLVIPKGSFEIIPHKLSKKMEAIDDEYSLEDYIRDNYSEYEMEYLSPTDKMESYIDGFIADEAPELADAMYAEMEYLRNGGYADLTIPTKDDNGADGDVSTLNFKNSTTAITEYKATIKNTAKVTKEIEEFNKRMGTEGRKISLGSPFEITTTITLTVKELKDMLKVIEEVFAKGGFTFNPGAKESRYYRKIGGLPTIDLAVLDNSVEEIVSLYHEMVHMLTAEYVRNVSQEEIDNVIMPIEVLYGKLISSKLKASDMFMDRIAYITNADSEASSVAEILAITVAEVDFRKELVQLLGDTVNKSMLQKAISFIKKVLNLSTNTDSAYVNSILDIVGLEKSKWMSSTAETNSASPARGMKALGSANTKADDMYMEMYQPTTVSVNNTRTEDAVDTTPKQKVQMYFNGSKSGEAREVKKVSINDNMLTLELVKGGTYQFDLNGRVTNGLHTGIAPEGSAKVKSIQANLRAILQSIEMPAIMPTQISKEAMLEAKAIIAEAKKKCEG